MLFPNKKADGGLTAIVIVIVALVFVGWLININSRECNSNGGCNDNEYCGSDFSCHQIPVIEKTTRTISLTPSVLIICLTIIALAVIWKWDVIFKKKQESKEVSQPETYYTSQVQNSAK